MTKKIMNIETENTVYNVESGNSFKVLTNATETQHESSDRESDSSSDKEDEEEEEEAAVSAQQEQDYIGPSVPQTRTEDDIPNIGLPTQQHETYQPNTDHDKGPILIISDSMLRNISQTKLAKDHYINKQYVRGDFEDCIRYVHNATEDTIVYKQILLHTGTNDVGNKQEGDISKGILLLANEVKKKWPQSKIIISGMILHRTNIEKNQSISKINEELHSICSEEDITLIDNTNVVTNIMAMALSTKKLFMMISTWITDMALLA